MRSILVVLALSLVGCEPTLHLEETDGQLIIKDEFGRVVDVRPQRLPPNAKISRATTQTEKYMSSIQRHRYELEAKLRKKGVDARIVRPRGFIIAAKRADLKTEEMREDFRVLNDSLKNIDLICFDGLLDNLKALRDRLNA